MHREKMAVPAGWQKMMMKVNFSGGRRRNRESKDKRQAESQISRVKERTARYRAGKVMAD